VYAVAGWGQLVGWLVDVCFEGCIRIHWLCRLLVTFPPLRPSLSRSFSFSGLDEPIR
jgi:hypothetical protein